VTIASSLNKFSKKKLKGEIFYRIKIASYRPPGVEKIQENDFCCCYTSRELQQQQQFSKYRANIAKLN